MEDLNYYAPDYTNVASLTFGNDYSTPNYGDWGRYAPTLDLYPYYPYYPKTYYNFEYTPPIAPTGTNYSKKDMPVVEVQVRNQFNPVVIKKVKDISSDGTLVKILYKEGKSERQMLLSEKSIVAMHKIGK